MLVCQKGASEVFIDLSLLRIGYHVFLATSTVGLEMTVFPRWPSSFFQTEIASQFIDISVTDTQTACSFTLLTKVAVQY